MKPDCFECGREIEEPHADSFWEDYCLDCVAAIMRADFEEHNAREAAV